MTERAWAREINDDQGRWRAQMVLLLSAQGMDVPTIAKVAFTARTGSASSAGLKVA
jgi:hypothetical protein